MPTHSLKTAATVSLESLRELQKRKQVLADRAVYLLDLVEEKALANFEVV